MVSISLLTLAPFSVFFSSFFSALFSHISSLSWYVLSLTEALICFPCPATLSFFHLSFSNLFPHLSFSPCQALIFPSILIPHFPFLHWFAFYFLTFSSLIFPFYIDLVSFSHFLFPHFPFSLSSYLPSLTSLLIFLFYIELLSFSQLSLPSISLSTLICFHFPDSFSFIFTL